MTVLDQPTTAPAFRLLGISKTYRQKANTVRALIDVGLEIQRGDFVAVQGPTGGGKSTLLQLLGALDKPTSGSIRLGDVDLSHAGGSRLTRVRANEIGFIFQSFNLIPTLSALDNVETGLVPLRLSAAERKRRALDALDRVGLSDRKDHLPSELSGGQQQRVAIARAIAKRPSVLLADEPTGNLDEHTRDEVMDVLESLHAGGLTLVVVTHDTAVARRAHRRLRLVDGHVEEITQ